MIRIFGHGPEGDGKIGPQIGGMGKAEVSFFRRIPVFGISRGIGIRGDDPPFDFHRIQIESIAIRDRAEPDVFHAVFPVGLGPAPFLPFPGNTVSDLEIPVQDRINGA